MFPNPSHYTTLCFQQMMALPFSAIPSLSWPSLELPSLAQPFLAFPSLPCPFFAFPSPSLPSPTFPGPASPTPPLPCFPFPAYLSQFQSLSQPHSHFSSSPQVYFPASSILSAPALHFPTLAGEATPGSQGMTLSLAPAAPQHFHSIAAVAISSGVPIPDPQPLSQPHKPYLTASSALSPPDLHHPSPVGWSCSRFSGQDIHFGSSSSGMFQLHLYSSYARSSHCPSLTGIPAPAPQALLSRQGLAGWFWAALRAALVLGITLGSGGPKAPPAAPSPRDLCQLHITLGLAPAPGAACWWTQ